jgi:NodT family efflux transporter outer membrane factor (OMF) lipoprotein
MKVFMAHAAGRLFGRLHILMVVMFLTSCAVLGPEYTEPKVDWLDEWQSDLYGQIGSSETQASSDLQFWWQLFDDGVLNQLIDIAKNENPSIRIAGLRILESRAALGIAGSSLYPQVQQLNGSVNYINTQKHGGTSINRDQDFVNYQAGPSVVWELDFWGRFKRGIESADAAYFSSIFNQYDVQVLLSSQVADLYFAYRTTLQNIVITKQNAAIQKRSFEITELLFKRGQDSELDLQQSKTQYLATLASIPNIEITLTQLRNALCALLGRAPGGLPELNQVSGSLPLVELPVIQEIPAKLLMRRPDIRASASQIAAQSAQIGIAKADFYPSISLLGSIGWSGNTLDSAPDTGSFSAGSGISWNIFDYGRIKNNVRLQDARLQQSIELFQNDVLQAAREIDDAAVRVVKTYEQKEILTKSLQSAERSLELANSRYAEGYSDFQRVIDAQRTLLVQSTNELVNRGNNISAVISLYKAIGGGWSETPIEEIVPRSTREIMESRTDWGELLTAPLPSSDEASSLSQGVKE